MSYLHTNLPYLNTEEKVLFEMFTDVLMSSNYLWTSEELGGLGYYSKFSSALNNNCNNLKVSSRFFGKWILADAIGTVAGTAAALVTTGGWASLPLCGGIPCAGVAGVIRGAGSSVVAAIYEYN